MTAWEDDLARSALPLAGRQPGPEVLGGERNSPVKGRQEGKAGMDLTLCKSIRWLPGGVGFSIVKVIHAYCGKHRQGGSSEDGSWGPSYTPGSAAGG